VIDYRLCFTSVRDLFSGRRVKRLFLDRWNAPSGIVKAAVFGLKPCHIKITRRRRGVGFRWPRGEPADMIVGKTEAENDSTSVIWFAQRGLERSKHVEVGAFESFMIL